MFIGCPILMAQYDAQLSNYWAMPTYYNPAYAGQSGNLEVTGLGRMQWIGFDNAPRSFLLSGNMPFNFFGRTHGVGLQIGTESYGLFNHSLVAAQYAYKKKLKGGTLSIGVQIGLINESFDGGDIYIPEDDDYHQKTDDGLPSAQVTGMTLDFALGFFYSKKNWYVGLSSTHLLEPEMRLGETESKFDLPRAFYLMGGYNIQLNNPLLELRPSVFGKMMFYESALIYKVDVNARLIYNDMFSVGLGWRNGDAVIAMLGGKFKGIEAGYSYDFPTSEIRIGSSGSHEIFVKYAIDLNLGKGKKNKHKSVRIL